MNNINVLYLLTLIVDYRIDIKRVSRTFNSSLSNLSQVVQILQLMGKNSGFKIS